MRNHYDRPYIVIHAPIATRRGKEFERRVAYAHSQGFRIVGNPSFQLHLIGQDGVGYQTFGTVLMHNNTIELTERQLLRYRTL